MSREVRVAAREWRTAILGKTARADRPPADFVTSGARSPIDDARLAGAGAAMVSAESHRPASGGRRKGCAGREDIRRGEAGREKSIRRFRRAAIAGFLDGRPEADPGIGRRGGNIRLITKPKPISLWHGTVEMRTLAPRPASMANSGPAVQALQAGPAHSNPEGGPPQMRQGARFLFEPGEMARSRRREARHLSILMTAGQRRQRQDDFSALRVCGKAENRPRGPPTGLFLKPSHSRAFEAGGSAGPISVSAGAGAPGRLFESSGCGPQGRPHPPGLDGPPYRRRIFGKPKVSPEGRKMGLVSQTDDRGQPRRPPGRRHEPFVAFEGPARPKRPRSQHHEIGGKPRAEGEGRRPAVRDLGKKPCDRGATALTRSTSAQQSRGD